jgi:Fe-S-cluster containining protein
MQADPERLRQLAQVKQAENLDFRRHLAAHHHHSLEPFQILATRIELRTDCRECANCCRQMEVRVTDAEIRAVAAHLGMTVDNVRLWHTVPDPEDSSQRLLRNTGSACTFLDGNLCLVYDARPAVCRNFPNVHPGAHTLGARMESICLHAEVCPILFEALEQYKHQVGYHSR